MKATKASWVQMGITIVLGMLPASCGETPAPSAPESPAPVAMIQPLESASFAGRLADNNTFIAVVMGGDAIRAYICDGMSDTWFDGTALRLPAMITAPDGTELYIRVAEGGIAGSVRRMDGTEQTFTAPRTQESALFRAETTVGEEHYLGGWITLPGGEQRGGVREGTAFASSNLTGSTAVAMAAQRAVEFLAPARFEPAALRERTPNQLSFNIMGMGDSYASGEGAPERNGNHGPDGVANQSGEMVEVWDQRATTRSNRAGYVAPNYSVLQAAPLSPVSGGVSEERLAIACHRSGRNGTRVAANILAEEWPNARVNAESFACSGAKVLDLVDRAYRGPNGPDNDSLSLPGGVLLGNRPQVEQVRNWMAANPGAGGVDAITVGIGGNDLGFADLIGNCLLDPNCSDNVPVVAPELSFFPLRIQLTPRQIIDRGIAGTADEPSMRTKFERLAAAITGLRAVTSGEVFLVDIPNPVRRPVPGTTSTEPCPGIDMFGIGNAGRLLVSEEEAAFVDREVLRDIHAQIEGARTRHSWSLVNSHVAPSAQHGFCTGNQAWFGTLLTGLDRQGADVEAGDQGWILEAISRAGSIVPPRLSGGIGHPNAAYHSDGLGPALADALRPLLRARVLPRAPNGLRVFTQTTTGNIAVRWNDRATTETEFRVRIRRVGTGASSDTQPDGEERLNDSLDTEYFIAARGRATYDVDVRACHVGRDASFEVCSAYTPALRVANFAPTVVPSGFAVRNEACVATNQCFPARVAWQPVANTDGAHVYYEVDLDGRRFATQSTFIEQGAASKFKVRSCNFLGCSNFSAEQTGPTRASANLSATQLSARCQSLASTQPLAGEPTLDPANLCP